MNVSVYSLIQSRLWFQIFIILTVVVSCNSQNTSYLTEEKKGGIPIKKEKHMFLNLQLEKSTQFLSQMIRELYFQMVRVLSFSMKV